MRYYVIKDLIEGDFRDKGSKFFSFLHPISNHESFKFHLSSYKIKHPKACHVCSAYRLYIDGNVEEYCSDDGEPSGSAGIHMLNGLKQNQLIGVAIFIVRYFGGTKLGIPGLINAYGSSTKDALSNINKVIWVPTKSIKIYHSYNQSNLIDKVVKQFDAKIINREFGEKIISNIQIKVGLDLKFDKYLFEASNGKLSVLN